ncbi:MAG TPA: ATP12 family protein, partial [Croceibacterium sp.]
VTVEQAEGGWRIALDGRPIRTQGGAPQLIPGRALAEAMALEWSRQGDKVAPEGFAWRDLLDFAIDHVRPDRAATIDTLLRYAETDTLCYRADPDDALFRRQRELWDPLLAGLEARHGVRLAPVSGIIHRAQPDAAMARLREVLAGESEFTLAALYTLAPLAASLTVALAALEPDADPAALFAAANCEEDWQAELWGWDIEAEKARAIKLAAFESAVGFARMAQE